MKIAIIKWIIANKTALLLSLIILFAALFRFYALNWDGEFYFHPDERNIADAVNRLDYTGCFEMLFVTSESNLAHQCDLNPNFFAYGPLPMYIVRLFANEDFDRTLILLRIQSAILSTAIIPLFYFICKNLFKENKRLPKWSLICSLFVAISPGLIQFAHFGTFEIFLTFQYSLLLLFLIKYIKTENIKWVYLSCLVIGLSISTKIISLAMLPVVFIILILVKTSSPKLNFKEILKWIRDIPYNIIGRGLLIIFATVLLTSPYIILDYDSFIGSINYESAVANGSAVVFYTQQFIGTQPVLYQFIKVFPYIFGMGLTLAFIPSFIFLTVKSIGFLYSFIKHKGHKRSRLIYFAVLLILCAYGIFHLSMYVKWTRYMIPLLPFMILNVMIFFRYIFHKTWGHRILRLITLLIFIILLTVSLYETSTFMRRYKTEDVRILFAKWTESNIETESKVVFETADMGVIPFEQVQESYSRTPVDMYNIEDMNSLETGRINRAIQNADYIILFSNRVYPLRFKERELFPEGYKFYSGLNNGDLGFTQVIAFNNTLGQIDSKIDLEYASGDFFPDETYNVFDNPTIIVYKRSEPL